MFSRAINWDGVYGRVVSSTGAVRRHYAGDRSMADVTNGFVDGTPQINDVNYVRRTKSSGENAKIGSRQ